MQRAVASGVVNDLGAMTWTDLGEPPVLVVPVGSCEQHGPHLPLHTDTVVAVAFAEALADRRRDCVVAPPLTITASGEHQGFPGTLSIGTDAMAAVIVELARSATWATAVVFVNGHGGNLAAMRNAQAVFDHEQRRVIVWWPAIPDADPHAGHTETSLMLMLAPGAVRLDDVAEGPTPSMAELVRDGVQAHSPTGVLGDPRGATASAGREIFAMAVDDLERRVAEQLDRWTSESP